MSLSIILPQVNGYIKYFENGTKKMSFYDNNNNMEKSL